MLASILVGCHPSIETGCEEYKKESGKTYEIVKALLYDEIQEFGGSISACYSEIPERYEAQHNAYLAINDLFVRYHLDNKELVSLSMMEADSALSAVAKAYIKEMFSDEILQRQFQKGIDSIEIDNFHHAPSIEVILLVKMRNTLFLISLDTCTSHMDSHLRSPLS